MTATEYGAAYQNGGLKRTIDFLRRRGARHYQAAETAQSAWVQGLAKLHQLRRPTRVVEWVIGIALRRFYDEISGNRRLVPLLMDGARAAIPSGINLAAIDLDRVLDKCEPQQETLLRAVYLLGWSPSEVADQLGISSGAVHHRLSRAIKRARREALRDQ